MNTRKLIEGLEILQGYRNEPDGFHIGCEHDTLYAYETDRPLSQEHISKMIKLGWCQENPESDDGFEVKHYDPEESWVAYL